MYEDFVGFVQGLYGTVDFLPLHAPQFVGREKEYLIETIDSTFVSSVGAFVNVFEEKVAEYTGAKFAVATVNGTAALHVALKLAGVDEGDEVLTQSLTFVATCNAIRYCGAQPVFLDVDRDTLGLSPDAVLEFLQESCEIRDDGLCWNKSSGRVIRACVPMHTFGHPVRLDELSEVCKRYNIVLVEDAAEALGSFYKGRHVGTAGALGTLSFNGNKIITTGGGGMILTDDASLAARAKHLTTTAKEPHRWAFRHDEVAFNYRMPNLNAALGVAQMECLVDILESKREVASQYQRWFRERGLGFVQEPQDTRSNYWLNAVLTENRTQRDEFLEITNSKKVMTRPVWEPMHLLPIYQRCQTGLLKNTEWLHDRLVNIPSSAKRDVR